jgi:hypothetical protein
MLNAPYAVAWVLRPWWELFWEGTDVRPCASACGGCDAACCGSKRFEVEGGEERGGEYHEAVAIED